MNTYVVIKGAYGAVIHAGCSRKIAMLRLQEEGDAMMIWHNSKCIGYLRPDMANREDADYRPRGWQVLGDENGPR